MENVKTQLEIANEEIVKLVPNITTNDRIEVLLKFSYPTLAMYLKGKGRNLDTAMFLLEFFRAKIEKRQEYLMGQ